MITLQTEAEEYACPDEGPLRLRVLLAYEDVGTGLRAKQALDRLMAGFTGSVDVALAVAKFELMRDPAVREQAVADAAQAEIIVLSAHGPGELPASVKLWLKQWVELGCDHARAMVVSLDAEAQASGDAHPTFAYVRALSAHRNIQVIPHFGPAAPPGWRGTGLDLQQRARRSSSVIDGILHRQDPWPPGEASE